MGGGLTRTIIISLFATLACVGIIKAATTVGNNISTTGTITGSGANTLYGATTIGGALTATSTLTVSGLSIFDSNVGIGTSSPYAKLSVVGEIVGSYFTATSTAATSTFTNISPTRLIINSTTNYAMSIERTTDSTTSFRVNAGASPNSEPNMSSTVENAGIVEITDGSADGWSNLVLSKYGPTGAHSAIFTSRKAHGTQQAPLSAAIDDEISEWWTMAWNGKAQVFQPLIRLSGVLSRIEQTLTITANPEAGKGSYVTVTVVSGDSEVADTCTEGIGWSVGGSTSATANNIATCLTSKTGIDASANSNVITISVNNGYGLTNSIWTALNGDTGALTIGNVDLGSSLYWTTGPAKNSNLATSYFDASGNLNLGSNGDPSTYDRAKTNYALNLYNGSTSAPYNAATALSDTTILYSKDISGAGTAGLNIMDEEGNSYTIGSGVITTPTITIGSGVITTPSMTIGTAKIQTPVVSIGSFLNIGAISTPTTISSGVITATRSRMSIDTEGSAATDTLDTINGGTDGDILFLRVNSNARDVDIGDLTGNINTLAARTLNNMGDLLIFLYDAGTYMEIQFIDNGS